MSAPAAAASFLAQVARITVPYVLAALGGTASERSGVINIALEGLLLIGAFAAAVGALATGSALAGVGAGVAAGIALAALYGLVVIRWRADQIVSGVAVTLLALGVTNFFLKLFYNSTSNSPRIESAGLGGPLIAAAAIAVAGGHVVLYHTRFGLRLRAVGEHPEAATTVGVRVLPLRWIGVLASGALAGLGGVWLAYDQHKFVSAMSSGRGFSALAAMILGRWTPVGALAACLLFGLCEAVQLRLQGHVGVAAGTLQALPHIATIVALALRPRGGDAPRALGRPYG